MAYGATDDFGFQAVEKRTSVHDLHATILHLLGFDHEQLTYRYAGRDFRPDRCPRPRRAGYLGVAPKEATFGTFKRSQSIANSEGNALMATAGELSGRVALITGAGVGIGRAIALELAEAGTAVGVHCNRSVAEADEVVF